MNLTTLIKQYFSWSNEGVTIDVFDEKNIYDVYQRVVGMLTQYIDIETTVLQAMSYCFYEILDNVLTHSGKVPLYICNYAQTRKSTRQKW